MEVGNRRGRRRARDEVDMDGMDASNIIRGGRRRRNPTLNESLQLLKRGDIQGFLDSYVVKRDFQPAFDLLGKFGQGHSKPLMTHLWNLFWEGKLLVVSLGDFRLNAHCIACRKSRKLKYVILEKVEQCEEYPSGWKELGVMGTDCYEIKFDALTDLAARCLSFTIDSEGDDEIVLDEDDLANYVTAIERVRSAPAKMAEAYKWQRTAHEEPSDE